MFPRPFPPPLWFELALVACAAALAHVLGLHALESSPVTLGLIGFLIAAAGWIWKGVQAVGQATIAWLHWAVLTLWAFAKSLWNAIVVLGDLSMKGLRHAWRFFRDTYEHVLKPAWQKFWKLVDTLRHTLERVLEPVFRVLRRIRDEIMAFYERFVRPVLDVIGIVRKTLRVFSTLGLEWAKRLDAKLGTLEEKIDAPFRLVLRKVNEVINLVNQVVTANGLFQRLALVRSIERDIRYVSRAFMNWRSGPVGDEQYAELRERMGGRTLEDVRRDTEEVLLTGGGHYGPIVSEMAVQWQLYLERRAPSTV